MKKILALVLTLVMLTSVLAVSASAVNEDVEGTIGIYSSMYQFVIDMMDEAIKAALADGTVKKLSEKWFKTDVTP